MNAEKLKLLIAEGEGLTVEFKERYTSKIDRDIVAFANTKGGHIILGVSDNGKIVGEDASAELGVKLGVKLGVNEVRIIALINENRSITIVQMAENLKISTTAVEKNIAKLKNKGLLRREGSDKTGHWNILKNI